MHHQAERAVGITDEARDHYRYIRIRRFLHCEPRKRCDNFILCPTCSWKRGCTARKLLSDAWKNVRVPGYRWHFIVVTVLYDNRNNAAYQVNALRDRAKASQVIARGVWKSLLAAPGSGAMYTIERGTKGKHGGHVHVNFAYYGPPVTQDDVATSAAQSHHLAGTVFVQCLGPEFSTLPPTVCGAVNEDMEAHGDEDEHDDEDEDGEDDDVHEAVKRIAKYISKGGATNKHDETAYVADNKALVLDARFDIATRGMRLSQVFGAFRGLRSPRATETVQPPHDARTAVRSAAKVPKTIATVYFDAGPRVPVIAHEERWAWRAEIFQRVRISAPDGTGGSTPFKVLGTALRSAASNGPNRYPDKMNSALLNLLLGFLSDQSLYRDPRSLLEHLVRSAATACGVVIECVDRDDGSVTTHTPVSWDEPIRCLQPQRRTATMEVARVTDLVPAAVTFAFSDGPLSGRHQSSDGDLHDETDLEWVRACVEHRFPLDLGTRDPVRIIEAIALKYLIGHALNAERRPSVGANRQLLLPALGRVTGWSLIAFDPDDGHIVYDDSSPPARAESGPSDPVADRAWLELDPVDHHLVYGDTLVGTRCEASVPY